MLNLHFEKLVVKVDKENMKTGSSFLLRKTEITIIFSF